jgi:LysR family transcriptional activator of nhaA
LRHLNYNHLLYFWAVSREGSIAKAADVLHITPQTISGQIKVLEKSIGAPLFKRAGRGLALTDTGRMVFQYADEIFVTGIELAQRTRGQASGRATEFHVGIVNSVPKLVAYRILEPALGLDEPIRVICQEASLEKLLGDLAIHRLDLVVSDHAIPAGLSVKAYNHKLGVSSVGFFAARNLAKRYQEGFPKSLDDAPVLMPVMSNPLRRSLDEWFLQVDVQPRIVAEFDDSALLKAFGEAGTGLFPAPMAIRSEIERSYRSRCVGEASHVHETYFAISPERRLKHPAVLEVTQVARSSLFEH